ncbi:KATNB1-like protein 1 isoform X2 [Acanthaster planci]|uniref:KATNB1-like protein 1 isoform X2 n=1 Tax=Acanthaster planci TaxID=133434 RepID=A0A8B7YN15_ACAPL|nr:KATNB1-like protein 1 isoform X2 [Acanthaster planci]
MLFLAMRNPFSRKPTAPSPYEQNLAVLRKQQNHKQPSFKVPVKKAYRQPLVMSNKQVKPSGHVAKGQKVPSPTKKAAQPAGGCHPSREDLIKMRERANKENLPPLQGGRGEACPPAPPPTELLAGHSTFVSIISNRQIHLNAALTFWRKNPGALVSYLNRTADDSVTVDVLPVLTLSLVRQTLQVKQISMGAWLEFLPTLHRLLGSKFADYIKVCLDLIRTLIRHWSKELEEQKCPQNAANLLQSQSVSGIYSGLISMSDAVNALAQRKGSVGKKAKVVKELLDKL